MTYLISVCVPMSRMSSANKLIEGIIGFRFSISSSMNISKSWGEMVEPCGTPLVGRVI
jgi:hypothetical protein